MKPGETDADLKTISFEIFDTAGRPANGVGGQDDGAVATFAAGDFKISYDYGASYNNTVALPAHGYKGFYRFTFDNTEVQTSIGQKNIWVKYEKAGFRIAQIEVPLRYIGVDSIANDAITAAAIAAGATTEIQTGLALAADLATLTGYVDTEVASIKTTVEALPSAAAIVAALFATASETGVTFIEAYRAITALALGDETDATQADTVAPILFKSFNGLKTRLSAIWLAGVKTVTRPDLSA